MESRKSKSYQHLNPSPHSARYNNHFSGDFHNIWARHHDLFTRNVHFHSIKYSNSKRDLKHLSEANIKSNAISAHEMYPTISKVLTTLNYLINVLVPLVS